ncbi:hypothetical protein FBZ94_103150 [Bradyrhizobium sacchari]|uniref:Uncharacterized protein n=1 Tax=Bradyrhizobium sacchari TaxID=1399419 RepID=A0A560JZU1_9BRAD|nr:hypothetical protein FBZ94_103150 [Bradyrhizobium sacchari]TWB76608.1 hypothetical protein FBZ95_104800 [Bradyrhizobium sacchari]
MRFVLIALAAVVAFKTFWFARWGSWKGRELADFDAFHIVAQRVWRGDLYLIYHFEATWRWSASTSNGGRISQALRSVPW